MSEKFTKILQFNNEGSFSTKWLQEAVAEITQPFVYRNLYISMSSHNREAYTNILDVATDSGKVLPSTEGRGEAEFYNAIELRTDNALDNNSIAVYEKR